VAGAHRPALSIERPSRSRCTAPYPSPVFERILRAVAILVSAVIIISFGLFAIDELNGASKANEAKLAQDLEANPPPAAERQREKDHGTVREAIDDANDVVVSPFQGIVSSDDSLWVQRG